MIDLFCKAWADAWEPPDNRPIDEWAAENIDLPQGGYAIPGSFNVEKSRHLISVFDALQNESIKQIRLLRPEDVDQLEAVRNLLGVFGIRMVNILKATQTAGTLATDIFVPWTVANAPGPIMWNWHNDRLAKEHAEVRAMPVIKRCKALKALIPENRHKSRDQSIIFRNNVPLYIQGPSENNLQGKSIRYLINDEVWQWSAGRLREAMARITQFKKLGTSKVVNVSQGGEIGDDWHALTIDSIAFEWEVPCEHCKEYQALTFEEKLPNGKTAYRMRWDADGGSIRYVCKHCGKEMRDGDALKAFFNEHGRYRCVNPDGCGERRERDGKIVRFRVNLEVVTFTWSSLIWLPWADLVADYRKCIAAKKLGALLPLKALVQKVMAKFWDESAQFEHFAIKVKSADYKPIEKWSAEAFRFLTIDCQAHFLEFWGVVRAWANDGTSRRLWRGKLDSFDAIRKIQEDWNVLNQFTILDMGYRQSDIFRICCRYVDENRRSWVGMKGSPSENFKHTFVNKPDELRLYSERQWGDPMYGLKNADVEKWLASVSPHALKLYEKGNLKCPFYLWSNPSVKDITANLRDGKGASWLAPQCDAGPDEEVYSKQMASEVCRLVPNSRGNEQREWHQIPGAANHYWDCENMQTVAAIIAGCLPLPSMN